MRSARRALFVLLLVFAPAALASNPVYPTQTPFWVPRELMVGSFFNWETTPQIWLKWEEAIYQQRVDSLLFNVEGGGGYAAHLRKDLYYDASNTIWRPINYLYQFSLVGEIGYRMDLPVGFTWGVSGGAGLMWYGARGQLFQPERYLVGTAVGRANFGWHVGKVVVGITAGYSAPFGYSPRSYSSTYLGGFLGGLYLNWR